MSENLHLVPHCQVTPDSQLKGILPSKPREVAEMNGYYIPLSSRWSGDLVNEHEQSTTLLMKCNITQLAALITLNISVGENCV